MSAVKALAGQVCELAQIAMHMKYIGFPRSVYSAFTSEVRA
jgi:hypothetical protein